MLLVADYNFRRRYDGQAWRLLVLGGFGHSGGDQPIRSFAGTDTWHDGISDGSVRSTLAQKSGETAQMRAWRIVGSAKFVPQIANGVTFQDTMFEAAVRDLGAEPAIFLNGRYDNSYGPNSSVYSAYPGSL